MSRFGWGERVVDILKKKIITLLCYLLLKPFDNIVIRIAEYGVSFITS